MPACGLRNKCFQHCSLLDSNTCRVSAGYTSIDVGDSTSEYGWRKRKKVINICWYYLLQLLPGSRLLTSECKMLAPLRSDSMNMSGMMSHCIWLSRGRCLSDSSWHGFSILLGRFPQR